MPNNQLRTRIYNDISGKLNGLLSAVDYITENKIEVTMLNAAVGEGSTMAAALQLIRENSRTDNCIFMILSKVCEPTRYD